MDSNKYAYKPYEDIYRSLFNSEKERISKILPESTTIEHFGSSAVPGLGGKGIIDIYVVIPDSELEKVSKLLQENLDYEHRSGGGDERRLFFRRHEKDSIGVDRTYHLHLSDIKNPNFEQSIALRNYLRTHPEDAKKYDEIKIKASKLAMQSTDYEEQKKAYQQAKSAFISDLNRKALLNNTQ